MKKFTSCILSKANSLALRARMALSNQRGDFYISDAVKIIIAVVLGALLLADLVLTIRQLALVSRLMKSVTSAGEALQLQLALGRAELADKLIALGAVDAVNLDGGGSSTMVGSDGKVLNRPSDTGSAEVIVERKISTAVVISEVN